MDSTIEERNTSARTAETIRDMVQGGFRLDFLLATAKMPRSTYYYQIKQLDKPDKNKVIKVDIQAIYDDHKGNYGYRRIY